MAATIIIVIIAVAFGALWYTGRLRRFADYIAETREELRKCTWPGWEELKGSTVVILVATVALGLFTVAVDFVFGLVVQKWL
jgi:preprotein translocase subunit SecE